MIFLRCVIIIFVCFFLNSCGRVVYFESDGVKHCIPSSYVISDGFFGGEGRKNKPLGLITLTFENDESYQRYLEPKSWLPGESLTALLVSKGLYEYHSLSSELNYKEYDFDEFYVEGVTRVFRKGRRSRWLTRLTDNSDIFHYKDVQYAMCSARGGIRSSELSQSSIDIPTSCYIEKVLHNGALLKITTSEQNLINFRQDIEKQIEQTLDSWICD